MKGNSIRFIQVGDRVYTVKTTTGTYAEYCVANANHVFHLPANVSFEEGSGLGTPYFTAYRALVIKFGHFYSLIGSIVEEYVYL